jgi:hypothetical protein
LQTKLWEQSVDAITDDIQASGFEVLLPLVQKVCHPESRECGMKENTEDTTFGCSVLMGFIVNDEKYLLVEIFL